MDLTHKSKGESSGDPHDTPSKWYPKESGSSHIYTRQNRFQAKKVLTRDRWIKGEYIKMA